MNSGELFPDKSDIKPVIYAYELVGVESHRGYIKVGETTRSAAERIREQTHTVAVQFRVLGTWSALRDDGTVFRDHDVRAVLLKRGFAQLNEGEDRNEWYRCSLGDVKAAVLGIQAGIENIEERTQNFKLREEQERAIENTLAYYKSAKKDRKGKTPKFLWNAKMRFGKTFAAYKLAERMGAKRVLILTFKPAVSSAWREDLMTHIDFEGWQFVGRGERAGDPSIDEQYQKANKRKPIVCFGSFQDFLGLENGSIKEKNEWVHEINWDLVIFDEYHFGAWRDSAKHLFAMDDDEYEEDTKAAESGNAIDESWLPITTDHYLFLSGTPFRALNSGEFIEEQIFNWTYADEQRAKAEWKGPDNPYAALPKMVMLTYKIPESIQAIAKQGEFDEFDLNVFFSAKGEGEDAKFVYEDYVQKWLNLIRGSYLETAVEELKLGAEKPPMPFSDARLLNVLSHTLWFLPNVASCHAMANLLKKKQNVFYHDYKVLKKKQNVFYHDYKVNVCAGTKAGIGLAALGPVRASMRDPLESKTITLSCGKLTTGVTIRPWSGIFMLRNLSSPETYFQAAFRVQSPWEVKRDDGTTEIVKKVCYVFDFALDRALKQISDYSCRLNVAESNPEKKVDEFIKFLPVLAYDGSSMRQVNAVDILDMAMSGTSATLLAKRWESALLVNVDNDTLKRLMANEKAMDALMRIEGFRSLNTEIETIINKSEAVKKAMKSGKKLTSKDKRELSQEEKEYKSKRKEIQEKLIKFATRIPVFMYLTDYREMSLVDVITDLEPELFKRVTGLNVKDFELLVSLNVFNEGLMNDAVYKFKRYEDASLTYTGIDKHTGENVGLYNTVLSREDYNEMAGKTEQSASDDAILANVGYSLRYRSYLPLYSLRAACGVLGEGRDVAPEGWVKADGIGRLDDTMVVVRAEGDSMEPTIHDGDLCVVRKVGGGNYNDQIILAQRNDKSSDPESGGAYLLKKLVKKGGKTLLRSINREYSDIVVERNNDIAVVAYLHKVMNG